MTRPIVVNQQSGSVVNGTSITIPKWQFAGSGYLMLAFFAEDPTVTNVQVQQGALTWNSGFGNQAFHGNYDVWHYTNGMADVTFDDIVVSWTGASDAVAIVLDVRGGKTNWPQDNPLPINDRALLQSTSGLVTEPNDHYMIFGMVGADSAITMDTAPTISPGVGDYDNLWIEPGAVQTNLNAGSAFMAFVYLDESLAGATGKRWSVRNTAPAANGFIAFQQTYDDVDSTNSPSWGVAAEADKTVPPGATTLRAWGTGGPGLPETWVWSQISGPAGATITDPSLRFADVTGLTPGVYTFRATGTSDGSTVFDDVVVTVAGSAFSVDAGPDQNVTVDNATTTATISGGTGPFTQNWTQQSGPPGATITDGTTLSPTFSDLEDGTYVFQIEVTDTSDGSTTVDTITIGVNVPLEATVSPANPTIPDGSTVNPTAAVVPGTGSGPYTYSWVQTGGPSATISDPAIANPVLTPTGGPGTYTFDVTVTDTSDGSTATQTVTITVTAVSFSVDSGADQTIPDGNSATTTAVVTGGTAPYTYNWVQTGGGSAVIMNGTTDTPTFVPSAGPGVYTFEVTVTDSTGATATDTITITVTAVGSGGSKKRATLVKLCMTTETLTACDLSSPTSPVPIKEVIIKTSSGAVIPHGDANFADSGGAGSDGSGFFRSYFTDASGNVIPAPAAWSYDCSLPEEPQVVPPLIREGCLLDDTNETQRDAYQIIPWTGATYDVAAATYDDPDGDGAITKLATEVFRLGPCGIWCSTC